MGYFILLLFVITGALVWIVTGIAGAHSRKAGSGTPKTKKPKHSKGPLELRTPAADELTPDRSVVATAAQVRAAKTRTPPA